jgi:RNA polymerase sigma-70 factor (ECF subfamily)
MGDGPTTLRVSESDLLAAARAGDEGAFTSLVTPHRGELLAHCYRMLGSVHDAEDALQETLLRAWRGLGGFAERTSLRRWLYRIATNSSLRLIERRRRRVLPVEHGPPSDPHDEQGPPLAETVWIEPFPDDAIAEPDDRPGPEALYERRESVELAFVAALQHLPARQRAALILREVLGFSAKEVAGQLETTVASVNSAVQRARRTLDERLPSESQREVLDGLGEARVRDLAARWIRAWETADVDSIVGMLTEDAVLAMPPMAEWYQGREAFQTFVTDRVFAPEDPRRLRLVPVHANCQLAFGLYHWEPEAGSFRAFAITVLSLRGDRVAELTGFLSPELFDHFGLPAELD